MRWEITEDQLREMVEYAGEHPGERLVIEHMDDGEPFLSCSFVNDDASADSGIWELAASPRMNDLEEDAGGEEE